MRKFCLLIVLSACGPQPHIFFPSHHVVGLGEQIPVEFGWYKMCSGPRGSIFDKNDHPRGEHPCDGVASSIDVRCTGRCDVSGTKVAEQAPTSLASFSAVTVVPLEVGAMAIVAKLTRMKSGESSSETHQLVVELPGVEICALGVVSTQRWQGPLGPCDRAPLDPRNARVIVRLYVRDPAATEEYKFPVAREIHSDLVKVNDRKLPVTSTVALADLFPNAVSNGAVQPGSYPLVVSLGNKILASQQVEVGPAPGSTSPPDTSPP